MGEAASPGALFWPSVWVGLTIAAPVGPIGLLVIQRTLRHGLAVGLATGLGAAAADGIYGGIGAFGVRWVVDALQAVQRPLALGGGAFLLWLAWRAWRTAGDGAAVAPAAPGPSSSDGATLALSGAFVGALGLTLANPATILSFVAVFGAVLGAAGGPSAAQAPWLLTAGVTAGSALWWVFLCATVGALRSRFDAGAQRAVGRVSAVMLAAFALWQWARLLADP